MLSFVRVFKNKNGGGRMKIAVLKKALIKHRVTNEIFVAVTSTKGDEKIFNISRLTSYGNRTYIELGDEG